MATSRRETRRDELRQLKRIKHREWEVLEREGNIEREREPGKQMEHLEKHTENAAKCAVGNV